MGDNMLYVTDFERQQNIYEKLKKAVNDGNYKINVYLKQVCAYYITFASSRSSKAQLPPQLVFARFVSSRQLRELQWFVYVICVEDKTC